MQTTEIGTIMSSYMSDNGRVLVFNIEVDDPFPKKLTYQCVLDGPNIAAVSMGHRKFRALVRACGKVSIRDSNELNGSKLYVTWDQDQPDERKRAEIIAVKPLPRPVPDVTEAPSPREPSRAWRWTRIAISLLWADFIRKPGSAVIGFMLLSAMIVSLCTSQPQWAIAYAGLAYILLELRGSAIREDNEDEEDDED